MISRRGQKRKHSLAAKEEILNDTSDDDNSPQRLNKAPSPATPIRETKKDDLVKLWDSSSATSTGHHYLQFTADGFDYLHRILLEPNPLLMLIAVLLFVLKWIWNVTPAFSESNLYSRLLNLLFPLPIKCLTNSNVIHKQTDQLIFFFSWVILFRASIGIIPLCQTFPMNTSKFYNKFR